MRGYWKEWAKAAIVRAVRTFAQAAVASIGCAVALGEVNWILVASSSALAAVLSILTSLAGLPEVSKEESDEYEEEA